MTKAEALQKFFSSFGITAYPSASVPTDTEFPWLTYDASIGNQGDGELSSTVNLWYHTESNKEPNEKVEEIAQRIGFGGVTLPYDGGIIWVKRGTPWAQSLSDDSDSSIKRRLLNITLEYL